MSLRFAAEQAEKYPQNRKKGQIWSCFVQSYDGKVGIRFKPPKPGASKRITFPVAAARKFADLVEFSSQQARYKMRIEYKH